MTASITEALRIARGYVADDVKRKPSGYDPSSDLRVIDAALSSLSCGEARERIAFFQAVADGYQGKIENGLLIVENPDATPENFAEVDPNLVISADAILATGCVPGEAAIRADEREKCASDAFQAVTRVVISDDGDTVLADHRYWEGRWRDADRELSTLRARVREVVGPFAEIRQALELISANKPGDELLDERAIFQTWGLKDTPTSKQITLGHLRAARQLMEEVK
ncbi:hypothetical protein [Afipia carboxidovorans]|uniref:hypothetical protein n=1 Tax=Afipia carboxidovorans TaxID=40137 RepID=UPI00308E05A9|nr:hypothetical protein CRBSH125_09990 [Afipia carboxidovorans]